MRKKHILSLALGLFLSLVISLAVVLGLSQNTLAQPLEYLRELDKVTEEIRILNLINGLELSEEQMKFIIQKAEEAEQLKTDLANRVNNGNPEVAKALRALQELRNNLLEGRSIPDDLKARAHQANLLSKGLTEGYHDKLSQLAFQIKGMLQPHQLCALENYVPCLIPPKPWAAGQENSSEAGQRELTKIRAMPAPMFEQNKERIAQQMLKQVKMHLPRGYIIDEAAEKEWTISLLKEARSLSGMDFAIKKTELAEKLKSRYAPPKLPIDITIKIEKFLLRPEVILLLKSKVSASSVLNELMP